MVFTNNVVLVTGSTGFLGKVVVEELLRLQETETYDVKEVILLLRKKGISDARTRFEEDVAASPCFVSLRQGWKELVSIVEGDLGNSKCGLGDSEYESICRTVTHIIHTAGCIKFDSEVPEAVSSNIDSSRHVLALAKDCCNLHQLVITSTAYVTPPQHGPIYEQLVSLPRPASELISGLSSGALGKQQAIAITGHPNIYSLSKCLAEHLVCETKGCPPVTLVRPSIICAALRHPAPGWIDSHAAFAGIVLGFGNGALRVVNGRPETKLDIVPVDLVAGCLIREAFRQDTRAFSRSSPRIVLSVATMEKSLTLGEACEMLEVFFNKGSFRYIGPQGHLFDFYQFLHHYLPLHLYATICRISGNRRKEKGARKAWKTISGMNVVFDPYTNHTHDFRPNQTMASFDPRHYMQIICKGVHKNLMHSRL
ncbi:male sterility protein-domain-containing protein [Dactylonectria macrodidyma]|uniref:Fatty acyl-CoA reductase n=1 Tax=Dactylonectria macrodidyma TaxID=307937 RepID=A0A9P9I6Y1_9HYPO|nr:male sterility protein-domain-containing protein [Dactylonectria macrodidyma]